MGGKKLPAGRVCSGYPDQMVPNHVVGPSGFPTCKPPVSMVESEHEYRTCVSIATDPEAVCLLESGSDGGG